jgi:hypothetical protein
VTTADPYTESAIEAAKVAEANRSPRSRRLLSLDRWVETTQYEGRQDWFADGDNANPLRERAPCIAYPIVRAAIDSNVDLCLGEGRYPRASVADAESEDTDDEEGIDGESRKKADAALTKITKQARLKPAFRTGFGRAQSSRSVALILGVRNGKPFADVEQAAWCTPTIGADGVVEKLEIEYPYTEEKQQRDGSWRVRCLMYRRVIDAQRDVTYKPAEARRDGIAPRWTEDPEKTVAHGLGYCPVVWYPHMLGCSTVARFDGRAIHEHCTDEVFCLDVTLSQWHRAAFFSGDPQQVEYGVDLPATGRTLRETPSGDGLVKSTSLGGAPSAGNPVNGQYVSCATRPARKKGPGQIVSIDAPPSEAKVELLTLPPGALKALEEHARDLRTKVAESLGVVFTDPESVRYASAMSGKAQQMLRARQTDRCDQYRDDMGDHMIVPALQMLVRICKTVGDAVKSAIIRAGVAVMPDDVEIALKWGPYFTPDEDDDKKTAEVVAAADKVLPLPDRLKAQRLASVLGIEDPEEILEEVEQERKAREERAKEQTEHHAHALGQMARADGPVGTRDRGAAGANPAPDAGGRGGSPVPAPGQRGDKRGPAGRRGG